MQDVAQAARESAPVRRIVVPVEGTDREYIVQEHAITLAAALEVPIKAVHVSGAVDNHENVFEWIQKHAGEWGVHIDCISLDGQEAAPEIVAELEPLDLVVIGSSHAGAKYHIGSVAEYLIRHASCPVQVVRLPS